MWPWHDTSVGVLPCACTAAVVSPVGMSRPSAGGTHLKHGGGPAAERLVQRLGRARALLRGERAVTAVGAGDLATGAI